MAVADLFLVSCPYGVHTTTNDALLAGLSLIDMAGCTRDLEESIRRTWREFAG